MKKRTHWWLIVWQTSGCAFVRTIFFTRRDARIYRRKRIGFHTTAYHSTKVIKVVEAESLADEARRIAGELL